MRFRTAAVEAGLVFVELVLGHSCGRGLTAVMHQSVTYPGRLCALRLLRGDPCSLAAESGLIAGFAVVFETNGVEADPRREKKSVVRVCGVPRPVSPRGS